MQTFEDKAASALAISNFTRNLSEALDVIKYLNIKLNGLIESFIIEASYLHIPYWVRMKLIQNLYVNFRYYIYSRF